MPLRHRICDCSSPETGQVYEFERHIVNVLVVWSSAPPARAVGEGKKRGKPHVR
jgi:hypothetical protein